MIEPSPTLSVCISPWPAVLIRMCRLYPLTHMLLATRTVCVNLTSSSPVRAQAYRVDQQSAILGVFFGGLFYTFASVGGVYWWTRRRKVD